MMRNYAVDARFKFAQLLAPDARMDCPNMTTAGRFQYVAAASGEEAITSARRRYLRQLRERGRMTDLEREELATLEATE